MATGIFLLYPSTINLEELATNSPLKDIEEFSRDELCYILQLPRYLPTISDKILTETGYTKIKSTIAQKFVRKYNQYLAKLCEINILETDGQFIIGKKAFGYKFLPPHQSSPLAKYEIEDPVFAKKLMTLRLVPEELKGEYDHLTQWFNGLLRINEAAAQAFIVEYQKSVKKMAVQEIFNMWTGPESDPRELKKFSRLAFDEPYDYQFGVLRINQDWYTLKVDETAGRFHSNLTNLKSELRHALTYNGEQLVSIDLKNSQPFISLLLLNPMFYKDYYTVKIDPDHSIFWWNKVYNSKQHTNEEDTQAAKASHNQILTPSITLGNIDPQIASNILGINSSRRNYTALITLVESNKLTESEDILLYRKLVESGTLYEYLEECMIAEGLPKPKDRRELKGIMFQVLFTDNSFFKQPEAEPKRLFARAFPTVHELFRLIKGRAKKDLPVLLQRIESTLFIETIAKRISKERPSLPIFTIHDSIVTTVGNEDYVQDVMREELKLAIGATPTFGLEYYTKQELERLTSVMQTANLTL
jgi:hypothetical protein